MNSPLKLFTDSAILARVQRPLLTRFLETYSAHLSPDAAALFTTSLNSLTFEEYCAAWATQFSSADQFGTPLQEALRAIELLALPENASILDDALSQTPPGYEISHDFSRLHQALHLWLLAHSPAGIPWPAAPDQERAEGREQRGTPPLSTLDSQPSTSTDASVPLSNLKSQIAAPLPSSISAPPAPDTPDDPEPAATAEAKAVLLRRLQPWPEPITDAPALFDQVHDRALHYLYLPPGAAVVFTLWPGHAHAMKAFTHSPRLTITSPEPGCGKSTALDFVACLCPNVLRTDNLRPAVVFRLAHNFSPTLALDEFDTYAHQYPDLRGLINSGYFHDGCAFRCEGLGVRVFKSFAATVLAGIGDLAGTIRDRSIIIHLTKAPASAAHARFDRRHTNFENTLGRKIARWAEDNFAAIEALRDPIMPPEAINRLADNWRPLFAIAQIIGGHWPDRLVEAFKQLTKQAPALDPGHLLLADIRQVFAQSGAQRMFTYALVNALRTLPGSRWCGGFNGQKPLNEYRLGRYLSAFGIRSRNLRIGSTQAKGYDLADFTTLFADLPVSDTTASLIAADI
jgi:hypothetical protein